MNIEKNKPIINLVIPTFVGVAVFLWAQKQNKKDGKQAMLFAAVGFVLAWLITRSIVKRIAQEQKTPKEIIYTGTSKPKYSFNPMPIVDSLIQDIYEIWGMRNSAIYAEVVTLNDAELMLVYNAYSKHAGNKDSETLIQAMEGESYGNFTTVSKHAKTIINRLKAQGAN